MIPNAFIVVVVVVGTALQSSQVEGIKCFVCLPRKEDRTISQTAAMYTKMFDKDDDIPVCENYHKSKREQYIKECPKEHNKGCLTQFESSNGSLMRICSKIAYSRCQELGGTTYCYCKNDLCNTPEMKLADPPKLVGTSKPGYRQKPVEQDLSEGSGGGGDEEQELEYPYDDTQWSDYDPGDYADTTDPTPDIQKQLEEEEKRLNAHRNTPTKPPANPNMDIVFEDERKKEDRKVSSAHVSTRGTVGVVVCAMVVAFMY